MRIDCLSFLDPFRYGGGGEMITRRLLEVGRARGHDIRLRSVRPRQRARRERPDFTLLIDVFNHAHSWKSLGAWRGFDRDFLHAAASRGPFAHLTTAYVDVCNLPWLPCGGDAAPACPFKPLPLGRRVLLRDFGERCFATDPLVRQLFEDAAFAVFASPLHQATHERVLGMRFARSHVLRPMIDTSRFRNQHGKRDIEHLFVGVISEAKGLAEMRARFRNSDIYLIGRLAPGAQLDFGRHVPHQPYEAIPDWMNRARNFVFLPQWPEPQGRVVCEAALCGCNIIANDKVGALSFGFDLADPAHYADVEEDFWRTVERAG